MCRWELPWRVDLILRWVNDVIFCLYFFYHQSNCFILPASLDIATMKFAWPCSCPLLFHSIYAGRSRRHGAVQEWSSSPVSGVESIDPDHAPHPGTTVRNILLYQVQIHTFVLCLYWCMKKVAQLRAMMHLRLCYIWLFLADRHFLLFIFFISE